MSECDKCRRIIDRFDSSDSREQSWAIGHLAHCGACSEYKAASDATATLVHLRNVGAPPPSRILDTLRERARKDRRLTLIATACAMTSLLALLWITTQHGLSPGSFILLAWFLGSSALAFFTARRIWRHFAYRRSSDFLESWRRDLDRKLLFTRLLAAVISVEVLVWLTLATSSGFSGEGHPVLLLINGTLGVGASYAWLVEIPALARERDLIHD